MSPATKQRTITVPEDLLLQLQRWIAEQLRLSAESTTTDFGDGVAMLEKLQQVLDQQQTDSSETREETTSAKVDVPASIEKLATEIIDEAAELNRVVRNAEQRWFANRKAREERRRRQAYWWSRLWDEYPGYHWHACEPCDKWIFRDYCEVCALAGIDLVDDTEHLKCLMDELLERYV